MSVLLAIGLVLQAIAVLLVVLVLGRKAIGLIGAAFIGVAVIFHGLTEVVQLWTPPNLYDPYASQEVVDQWVWIAGLAILVMTVSYLVTLGRIPVRRTIGHLATFDWRVLLVASVPIYFFALQYTPSETSGGASYWLSGLSSQFLIIALTLASFDFIRRHDGQFMLLVLLAQALILAPIGSRWTVAAGLLLTLYALKRVGITLPRGHLAVAAMAVITLTILISSSRSVTDPATGASLPHYHTSLLQGAQKLPHSTTSGSIVSDWDYRFDGNTFPALIGQALREGNSPVDSSRLVDTALLAVPSFVYPTKADLPLAMRNEETYMVLHFRLPHTDYLPTTFGTLFAYGGTSGLLIIALLLGVGFAWLDRWVLARLTLVRLLVALGFLLCVLLYEQGTEAYVLTLRGIVVLVVMAKFIEFVGSTVRSRRRRTAWNGST